MVRDGAASSARSSCIPSTSRRRRAAPTASTSPIAGSSSRAPAARSRSGLRSSRSASTPSATSSTGRSTSRSTPSGGSRPTIALELVTPAPRSGVLDLPPAGRARSAPGRGRPRNQAIVAALAAAGDVLLTSTVIGGRYAIRLCVLNHGSGETTSRTRSIASPRSRRIPRSRTTRPRAGAPCRPGCRWRGSTTPGVDAAWLGACPPSPARRPDQLERLLGAAHVRPTPRASP